MRRGSSVPLWMLAGVLFLRKRNEQRAAATPATPAPGEVAIVQTGGSSPTEWTATRTALAFEVLFEAFPGVGAAAIREVARSIVAQWAHETGRGKKEFNFNLGGWTARKSDPFFAAQGAAPGEGTMRWTAYPSLPVAVMDQIRRLHDTYPSAWRLLITQPLSSAWVEELGRRGYYKAKPADYARAWAMHRAELGRLAA